MGYFVTSYTIPDIAQGCINFAVKVGFSKPDFYQIENVNAIVDTGADISCISNQLANILGVISYETKNVDGITEIKHDVPIYKNIDLILSNGKNEEKIYENLTVAEFFRGTKNYDFIIGRDILRTGDMLLTHANGKTVFSFRTPSGKSHLCFNIDTGKVENRDIPLKRFEQV